MSKFIKARKRFHKICRYPVSDFAIIVMLSVSFFCLFLGGKAQQAKTMEEQDESRFSYLSEYYADFITGDMDMDISALFASDKGNISVTNVDVFSDYEGSMRLAEIILNDGEALSVPLTEGTLLTKDTDTDSVVMIGQGLKQYAEKRGTEYYIQFDGEEYRVTGICGGTNSGIFDHVVIFSYERMGAALRKKVQQALKTGLHLVIQSNLHNSEEIYAALETRVLDLGDAQINGYADEETEGAVVSRTDDTGFYWLAALFCIVNTISVSEFWVYQRRTEIQIRRKIGQSKAQIIRNLYTQNIKISGIAAGIVFLLKTILQASEPFLDVPLTTDFYDVIILMFCMIAGSAIVILYPLYQLRTRFFLE